MGLRPTVRPGETRTISEIERFEDAAHLPSSRSAVFLKLIAALCFLSAVAVFLSASPAQALVAIATGGIMWAAGALQQNIYDMRTLMLRHADAEQVRLRSQLPESTDA